jgi:hypothetical protein
MAEENGVEEHPERRCGNPDGETAAGTMAQPAEC